MALESTRKHTRNFMVGLRLWFGTRKSRTRVQIPFKAIFRVLLVFIYLFLSLVSVHLCYV